MPLRSRTSTSSPFHRHFAGLLLAAMATALAGCAMAPDSKPEARPVPTVAAGDPALSFWRDQVEYAYPVDYATTTDSRGVAWEIAYMDVYRGRGDKAEAQTLVLVHGKGANAGYFSQLMGDALAAGLRVVAFDLPNYGKSIPGNLDKPVARTLDDTREAAHELLVERLGIEQAAYLGHSQGGQWVIGYALRYPEAVSKVILEAPSGLEEYPTAIRLPSGVDWPVFDPSYRYDYERWNQVWGPLGHLKNEFAKTEHDIRAFYYFRQVNKETGEVEPSEVGYFRNDSVDARFLTETRVQMIRGNDREYDRYIKTYVRDVYSLGIEVRQEDPESLYKRLPEIDVPVLIVFGDGDPFIPTTVLSGLTDLRTQIIKPAYEMLAERGPEPMAAVYEGAGHFVHTDYPDRFAADVIGFVRDGRIESEPEDPEAYSAEQALPEGVQAFIERDEQAFASGDIEAIMANYHTDYRDGGRDKAAQRAVMQQFLGMTRTYEVITDGIEPVGENKAVIRGGIRSDLGTLPFPKRAMIIKDDGRWYWYGDQQ
ncbi:alpha/beta hydrolase [Ectothiorhodospiraceae bacterium WFHF3C12]|nr:alpha/beta hydrolase [Ectothiorhodospiraceae bacterium WFHF3C12]